VLTRKKNLTFYMLANAISPHGTMGGNTKIMLELARRWAITEEVNVITYEDGLKTCLDYDLDNVNYIIVPSSRFVKFGLVVFFAAQILRTCISVLKIPKKTDSFVLYSASSFWPDVIPAVVMKKRIPHLKWIGSCYLLAPNPFKGFEGKWRLLPNIRLLASNFMESITNVLLRKYADAIFVTNDLDKKIFSDRGFPSRKVRAIYGGVELAKISKIPKQKLRYEGCFVGRVHPQKGVLYLVDIWDKVCKVKPYAKLALIGNGPDWYENRVKNEIRKRHLGKNIDLFGFVDGTEKYKILKSSKVFLHASVYDNCGMTAAEAMTCGLPAVRFDIPALKVAYPKGMLIAPLKDCEAFAKCVLTLLEDDNLYEEISRDALESVKDWDWDKRAQKVLTWLKITLFERDANDKF
jgi:glycosyltransferase involved in cell wall biosynthesis